jgi:hypothetical protein
MKTNVQMYRPPNDSDQYPKIPRTFYQLRSPVINYVTSFMRLFGIANITVRPSSVGIKSLLDISFKPLSENPPPEFMQSRGFLVRNLGELMILFGLLSIEMLPTEEEMKAIRMTWSSLIEGKMEVPSDIRLNLENDPTAESVLPNGPQKDDKNTAELGAAKPEEGVAKPAEPPAAGAGPAV